MTYSLYLGNHQHILPPSSGFLRSSDLTMSQNAGLVVSQPSERRTLVTWHEPHNYLRGETNPRIWRSNSKRYLCWDLCCPLQNQWCSPIPDSFQFQKLSQWAKMIHRAFIYVTNKDAVSKGSCTDLALIPLRSMAELQLMPAGVELTWWEIILKIRWKKTLNHIWSPFPPSLHTSTSFSWSH